MTETAKYITKVEIKGNPQKGKIELYYYSMEDLERLMEIIENNKSGLL